MLNLGTITMRQEYDEATDTKTRFLEGEWPDVTLADLDYLREREFTVHIKYANAEADYRILDVRPLAYGDVVVLERVKE